MTNYNILEGAVMRQAVQLSPLRCVLHIRQTSSFFSGGGGGFGDARHPAGPAVVMQAVQDVPAGFKGSTLSCDGASIRMGTDETVCRGVMDSGGHYSAAGLMMRFGG